MATEAELVAFNPADADLILSKMQGAGGESIMAAARVHRDAKWATTVSSIAANATGYVYMRKPTNTGWTDTTSQVLGFNESGLAIPASKKVILFTIDGRWCVFDVCP